MLYMKKLKIILVFSFLILFLYNLNYKSKYNLNDTNIKGIIDKYKITNNKLELEIKGKERIICNLYFKTDLEKEEFSKKIKLGQTVNLKGKMNIPKENSTKNLFNYRKYLKSKKIYYTFTIEEIKISDNKNFLYTIKNNLIKRINNLNSPYLYAFILGDTSFIETNIKSTYQTNGISHLLAISGMHITLLFSTIYKLLNKIKKTKINLFIVSIILIFYLFLVNFTPSSIRSGLMFIILNFNKKIKSYQILFFILVLLLCINPYYIYNNGFILSFVVSFYILIFKSLIKGNYFSKLFMTSFIAFIAGLPILIYNYNSINILSIFLNLLFVPLVTYIIFPLSFISLIFNFTKIYNFFTNLMEQMSLFFDKISINIILRHIGIFIIIYVIIGIIVLYKLTQKKYKYLFLYLLVIFIHSNIYLINSTITFLDIGQGDSALIELPFNKGNILIDTGGNVKNTDYSLVLNTTIPYLKKRGIKKINYLILTHGDYDHIGEAINLINNYKVDNVIFNIDSYNDLENNLIGVIKNKKINYYKGFNILNINDYKFEFLNTRIYDNENDNSNIIYFVINNYKFLFMGDAGKIKESDLLKKYDLNDIDFLKVGHHGSNTSSSKDFINHIKPKYAIISVGKYNIYGHPKDSVLHNLRNSNIYRTDLDGSVEIILNKNGYKIKTCN